MPRARLAAAALVALALWPATASADVLWDQLDQEDTGYGTMAGSVQQAADFTVTVPSPGQFWRIDRVDIVGNLIDGPGAFQIGFFTDSSFLPAINEFVTYNPTPTIGALNGFNNVPMSFPLDPPLKLQPGRYWVSVQGIPDDSNWLFSWIDRKLQKDSAAVGRGTGTSCSDWGLKTTCPGGWSELTLGLKGAVESPPPADQQPPPDTSPPGVALGGPKKQSIGDGAIEVDLQATEAGTATASATVSVAKRFLAARSLKFRRVTKPVAPGTRSTLKLRLSKRSRKAVLRALKAGRRESAKIIVTVSDTAANRAVRRKTVALKR
jgi:hypothetical protein